MENNRYLGFIDWKKIDSLLIQVIGTWLYIKLHLI